jgi:dihydrofolate synthase/folylpolyglutamate synthase
VRLRGLGGEYDEVFLPLFGEHQARNAAAALAAVESFFGLTPQLEPLDGSAAGAQPDSDDAAPAPATVVPPGRAPEVADDVPLPAPDGPRRLDPQVVRAGFASVTSPGRLEVVRRGPTVVVDAAHNAPGAQALAQGLAESFTFTRTVGVVGILADKDAAGILTALEPVLDEVVITRSSSPRALPVEELAELAASLFGEERVLAVAHLDEALERAIELAEVGAPAGVGGGVLVTGSVTVVGEARLLLGAESGTAEGGTRAEHGAPRGRAPQDPA